MERILVGVDGSPAAHAVLGWSADLAGRAHLGLVAARVFVSTQAESHAICAEVNAPNLKMQMDCYHMQIMEGDLATKLRRYMANCGHIQIAGVPERHEPDTGEVRYEYLYRLLDELGYDGWIGCEYRPAGKTADGLGWLPRTVLPA